VVLSRIVDGGQVRLRARRRDLITGVFAGDDVAYPFSLYGLPLFDGCVQRTGCAGRKSYVERKMLPFGLENPYAYYETIEIVYLRRKKVRYSVS